jgi:hypothetical protein
LNPLDNRAAAALDSAHRRQRFGNRCVGAHQPRRRIDRPEPVAFRLASLNLAMVRERHADLKMCGQLVHRVLPHVRHVFG